MIKKTKAAEEVGQASNRIMAGTSIEGDISSKGDIRVDGSLKGNITITGKLVVGEKGWVEGEIKCSNANVSGDLRGKIEVSELLSLQATARVNGEVLTNKLSVEPGAEFSGSCSMGSVIREIKNEEGQQSNREKETSGKGASA
jgi:cytoskeletal protein CcmA (bactofilin family)